MSRGDPGLAARSPRLAVLIDADNTSPKVAEGLFLEVAKLGEASVRRIYGDFSQNRSRGWADVLAAYAIVPQQQFAYTQGKNSADISLVIDAMDLLHSGRFEGFCLVSSDSDFARLAARIREQGLDVYGFGQRKTPLSFTQACKRFFFIENLTSDASDPEDPAARDAGPEPAAGAIPLLRNAFEARVEDEGWITLSQLGNQVQKLAPQFDTRSYGSAKLGDLVAQTGIFEIDRKAAPARLRLIPEPRPAEKRRAPRKPATKVTRNKPKA